MATDTPLIVGAGPAGLTAALFLRRAGRDVRIIDKNAQPEAQSRALAVNPRTLQLLAETGVTDRMLQAGLRINHFQFHLPGGRQGEVPMTGVHPTYPYMIGLSQAMSEKFLTEAFERAGGSIERGTELVDCLNTRTGVLADLKMPDGGVQTITTPWLLGADGSRSLVRKAANVSFHGNSIPEEWLLADVPLDTPLAEDAAHIEFCEGGGFVFCIRVVDERQFPKPLWRVMSNRADQMHTPIGSTWAGEPAWQSKFHISHRIVSRMRSGRLFLAGDAAHLHSPVGARGMNLGVEDAYVFAQLAIKDRLHRYGWQRRRVDKQVVRAVRLITDMAEGKSGLVQALRSHVFPHAIQIQMIRNAMRAAVTGQDHAVTM